MPHVHVSQWIGAAPAAVYELFRDPETFPDFMPSVTAVRVEERGEEWGVSHWMTDLDGAPLEWREADHYDAAHHVVTFQLIEGDIERFEGRWVFEPSEGGTLAVCDLDYELGVSVIEEAVGPIIQQKVEHNLRLMLAGVKERVEAGGSPSRTAPWDGSSR